MTEKKTKTVRCILCQKTVSLERAVPGPGSHPVHPFCLYDGKETPSDGRLL